MMHLEFFIAVWAVMSSAPRAVFSADPCTTATIFNGPISRSSNNVQAVADVINGFCDSSLVTDWYRLKANNIDVDLPTAAPAPYSCNTLSPVWMNGAIPAINNVETTLTACTVVGGAQCNAPMNIKVINCDQYRVYQLQKTNFCPSAYCFDLKTPCPPGTSSETGNEPGCSAGFPVINISPVVEPFLGMSTENNDYQDLRFNCAVNFPSNSYFYDVIWRINGNEVARFTKLSEADLSESGVLLETTWKYDYSLGMNVQCAVRVRASSNGVPSPVHKSDTFFAGLKVLDPAIELTEGEMATVRYQATVPVPCKIEIPCSVLFTHQTYENFHGVCERNETTLCGFYVNSLVWNLTDNQLAVSAAYDGMYGNRIAEVFLKSVSPVEADAPQNVWADVTPQPVLVNIHDTDTQAAGSICKIYNDPHFRSFDGRYFDVHLPGEFVLYRHKVLPIEVRGFFQPCGWPACICGAAVRSGSQIFVYSKCTDNLAYQTTRVRVYGCNKNQMRVTLNGSWYKIELPNGMIVYINIYGNTHITPTDTDIGQTEGLCGNFNGKHEDDFIDPFGNQHNPCLQGRCIVNNYGKTWRIDDPQQSFYGYPQINLGPTPIGRCSCNSTVPGQIVQEMNCENVPPTQCEERDPEVTDEYCTELDVSPQRRRKRQTRKVDDLNADDVRPVFPSYDEVELQPPTWINGWDEEKARSHCDQFFRQSPSYIPCSKVGNLDLGATLEFCVTDILFTGTTEWTIVSLESYKQECVSEVKRNTTLRISFGNEPSVYDEVMNSVCPGECSFHGSCRNGRCVCNSGWIGVDCSVEATKPPDVTGLPRRGLCNLRDRTCDRTLVFGTRFVQSDSLTCKFEQVYIKNKKIRLTGNTVYVTNAYFRHSDEVVCSLPVDAALGTDGTGLPIGYYLSVSNNNNLYSNSKLYLPYDSDDFTCTMIDEKVKCRKVTTNPESIPPEDQIPYQEWVNQGCGKKIRGSHRGNNWTKKREKWCSYSRWLNRDDSGERSSEQSKSSSEERKRPSKGRNRSSKESKSSSEERKRSSKGRNRS